MKKIIPALLILITACNSTVDKSYIIEGKVTGKVPAKAYLQTYVDGETNIIDSTTFTNGQFKFKGSVEYPEYYYIKIGDNQRPFGFFIENSKIKIKAHIDSLEMANVTGSRVQDKYENYLASKEPFEKQLAEIYRNYKAATDENKPVYEAQYDSISELQNQHIKNYVKANNNSVLAPYIVRREIIYYLDLEELKELAGSISPELKDHPYTKELFKRIRTLEKVQPGMEAPAFTQNDTAGNPVSLSDFKGQYLLIDFWASWCGPCRRANPTVVEIYKKYAPQGFTILGVSMDSDKEAWLKAIKNDQLTWTHVSTLEGWGNPVGKLYGVLSIPHAVLIDPDGKILKYKVHADELNQVLEENIK